MGSYRLTKDADGDIQGKLEYTLETWGLEQTRKYAHTLEACFISLGNMQPALDRCFIKAFPELFVRHCEHHQIFYIRLTNKDTVAIIAILHEKMDLITRIRSRLEN